MFVFVCKITLGGYVLRGLHEVKVVSSWANLTDTCTLKVAKAVLVGNKQQKLDTLLKRGDECKVEVGYNGKTTVWFSGYITGIKPGTLVEVTAEDEMVKLKEQAVTPKAWKSPSLRDILTHCGISNYELLGDEVKFDAFSIGPEEKNAAQVLQKIKQAGMYVFYVDGTLHIGNPHEQSGKKTHIVALGYNVVESELEYRSAEDVKIEVVAIANLPNGQKRTVKLGDAGGEKHTLNFRDLSEADLRTAAEAIMPKLRYSGFRGNVKLLGLPFVKHGDIVHIIDQREQSRSGKYFIASAERSASISGGVRQVVTVGKKATA